MKKYELTKEKKTVDTYEVYRIRYMRDIPDAGVGAGMLGGFIENEENLSHEDDCVVLDEAVVCGGAKVLDNAVVSGLSHVTDNSVIKNQARISGSSVIRKSVVASNALVQGRSIVEEDSRIFGDAQLRDTRTKNTVSVYGNAVVMKTKLEGLVDVKGNANVQSSRINGRGVIIMGNASVQETRMRNAKTVKISDSATVDYCLFEDCSQIQIQGNAKLTGVLKLRLAISGNNITIGDNAVIDGTALLVGDDIALTDNASVIGYVRIGDNVKLSEMASLENKELHEMFVSDVQLFMDSHFVQSDK